MLRFGQAIPIEDGVSLERRHFELHAVFPASYNNLHLSIIRSMIDWEWDDISPARLKQVPAKQTTTVNVPPQEEDTGWLSSDRIARVELNIFRQNRLPYIGTTLRI